MFLVKIFYKICENSKIIFFVLAMEYMGWFNLASWSGLMKNQKIKNSKKMPKNRPKFPKSSIL